MRSKHSANITYIVLKWYSRNRHNVQASPSVIHCINCMIFVNMNTVWLKEQICSFYFKSSFHAVMKKKGQRTAW